MKRVMAIVLTLAFAAIGSGCISLHKETHEAAYQREDPRVPNEH